ncbi:HSP70/90 co-chaperone [Neonectria punicea]|uniref:HSP70/90 co-chaperone n=1 Tax=Neonectria punicea TaxID=979145 RepID=A0ABR1GMY5_9HYPO
MDFEAIADQMEAALKLSKAEEASGTPPQSNQTDATTPALPLAASIARANRGKTVDEVVADLKKSPLFMTDLDDADPNNDDIAALQALAYEGTPLENSSDFKDRGNECFKVKGYADAKEFYTKGIAILSQEERKRTRGETATLLNAEPDSDDEIARQRDTLESLYVNRAACHLALANYRSCWTDCAAAMRLNPRNVKAHYRSARALLAVGRIAEADDVCARGLALDAANAGLRAVADDIVQRARETDARRKADAEREARTKRQALLLKAALRARNIPTRTTAQPPEMEDARLELVPDADDPRSTLSFPAVLLYPLHLESDFIKAFNETQTLEDHLAYVFPLPWDREGAYTPAGVECYVETREGGLLKMGKRLSLLKVLGTGKVEVVDEVVRIFVLPRARAEAWIKEHKAKRASEKGEGSQAS